MENTYVGMSNEGELCKLYFLRKYLLYNVYRMELPTLGDEMEYGRLGMRGKKN